ncbi:hypothetical protein [Gemmobacter serpentinus]|uniref:hypothetical protein n=1 Tax=Gemmobacter serpentinus TaxID=2652247 RepID=UPI00124CE3FB|nr:hypothetical protein [Gemmobacter serpentinus]
MSVKTVIAALALVTVAGAASAQSINPGTAQLAAQLGVEPGRYSLTELVQLQEAKRENDVQAIAQILGSGTSASTKNEAGFSGAGKAQIEAQLRVEAGRFTSAELSQLTQARRDGDREAEAYILSGARNAATDPASVNAGKAQIAAQLHLDPSQYTLAELVAKLPQSDS